MNCSHNIRTFTAVLSSRRCCSLAVARRMDARASTAGLRSAPVGAGRMPLACSIFPGLSRKKKVLPIFVPDLLHDYRNSLTSTSNNN